MREKVARQLCGRDFDIVKEGLDASQVEELVTELVTERDTLLQRQEHLTSLTRLAERSVAEADALAKEIQKEAEDEARSQSSAILAQAEQEAQKLAEQKRNEILSAANKEAQAIKENAQKEVALLISQQQENLQNELGEIVQSLHSQLLGGLKDVTDHATALQTEWQNKISEAFNVTAEAVTSEPAPPAEAEPEPVETAAQLETPEPVVEAEPEPAPVETSDTLENTEPVQNTQPEALTDLPETQEPDQAPEPKAEMTAEPPAGEADLSYRQDILAQIEQAWMDSEKQATDNQAAGQESGGIQVAEETASSSAYEGTLHLDILPPLTPSHLVEIQKYLRAWPGIGITELSPSKNKGYSITIVLQKPMQLIDILKELPEVDDARDYTPEDGDIDTPCKEGGKRIRITVCNTK